ncbi:putative transaldolase [Candidatus Tremblaya princeps PCIT]|uniref:transaldolase n=1 Tax=Tremblaya princeps (strain PCIT) TaxID=891398 RepID=F7XYM4_TREPP|nr:putative transaldolase [Candidatus Tremblaya princeps PCIT]AEK38478.1 transaldolase [Candidatus Tremblaya princeps PCVAL]
MVSSALQFLSHHSELSMDSARFLEAFRFRPTHATTNPSLILSACQNDEYNSVVNDTISLHRNEGCRHIADHIRLRFGTELLDRIPGLVSVEIDPSCAFNVDASLAHARRIVQLCKRADVRDRILVKIPATWHGVQAAAALRAEGVQCNMTLVFSMLQALVCARNGAFLISPFVGRLSDRMPAMQGSSATQDQGVALALRIYSRFRQEGHATRVMAASFRCSQQVIMASACGMVTVGEHIMRRLAAMRASAMPKPCQQFSEAMQHCPTPRDLHCFERALAQNRTAWLELKKGLEAFACNETQLSRLIERRLP